MAKKKKKKKDTKEKITVSDGEPEVKVLEVHPFGGDLRTKEQIEQMKELRQEELLVKIGQAGFKISKQALGVLWQLGGVDTDEEITEFIEWYKNRYKVITGIEVREFIMQRARKQVHPSIQALANKGKVVPNE